MIKNNKYLEDVILLHSWKDSVPTKFSTVLKIIAEMKTKPQYLIIWCYIKLGSKPKMPHHLQIIITFIPKLHYSKWLPVTQSPTLPSPCGRTDLVFHTALQTKSTQLQLLHSWLWPTIRYQHASAAAEGMDMPSKIYYCKALRLELLSNTSGPW